MFEREPPVIRPAMVRLARQALRSTAVRSAALGALRLTAQPMSTVLMLHRFDNPLHPSARKDSAVLRDVLATLRRQGVELLPLSALVARMEQRIPSPRPTVSFTVDDGYSDFASIAAPIFAEFDCPVTVFLSTDIVSGGGWYWWDRLEYAMMRTGRTDLNISVGGTMHRFELAAPVRQQSLEALTELVKFAPDDERREISAGIGAHTDVDVPALPPEQYRTLTWDEVRRLERDGNVCFGPHSCSHPMFSRIDDATARREITESWAAMRRECARPEPIFCFPNGTVASFGDRDVALVREAGLRAAVTYIRARISTGAAGPMDAFRLPRYEMPRDSFDVAWLAAAIRARP